MQYSQQLAFNETASSMDRLMDNYYERNKIQSRLASINDRRDDRLQQNGAIDAETIAR